MNSKLLNFITRISLSVADSAGLAQRKAISCAGKILSHKISVIPFPKQDVTAACNALSSNLGDDLVAWIGVDAQTPNMQHLSDKDTAAFVKNGKIER